MEWLNANVDALPTWAKKSGCPLLVSKTDGEILWANEAFEELLGYTLVEVIRLKWTDLTVDKDDLEDDQAMARQIMLGERNGYQFHKRYRSKDGSPVPVVIHVLRYPLTGDFQFFLVTCIPIDHSYQFAVQQLNDVRQQILEYMSEHQNKKPIVERIWEWGERHPFWGGFVIFMFAVLLFGERVFEILRKFLELVPRGE